MINYGHNNNEHADTKFSPGGGFTVTTALILLLLSTTTGGLTVVSTATKLMFIPSIAGSTRLGGGCPGGGIRGSSEYTI